MTITKGHYYLAGIIAAGIILGAFIFRGCDSSPDHREDIKAVQSLQDKLRQTEQKAAQDSARLARHGDSLQASLLDLENKKDIIAKELSVAKTKVIALASANEKAKTAKDTARYIETCDSLRDLAKLQAEVITMYQENDSLRTENYEQQLSAKDSLLANRASLITQLRATNNQIFAQYQELGTDYKKVTRKLKRERTLSRILAIATAVGGGIILLK